jgi:hypothetical protein
LNEEINVEWEAKVDNWKDMSLIQFTLWYYESVIHFCRKNCKTLNYLFEIILYLNLSYNYDS